MSCKDCKDRYSGCQDACIKLVSEQLVNIEEKETIRKNRRIGKEQKDYIMKAQQRMRRGKRK